MGPPKAKDTLPSSREEDPEGFSAWRRRHLVSLEVRNLTKRTVKERKDSLGIFLRWCHERELTRPTDITRPILESYQRYLFYRRSKSGKPLSVRTQQAYLTAVRMFFRWLTRQNVLLTNPAGELEMPRHARHFPREILTPGEVETILSLPDLTDYLGLRDRAILETFYSTGMRRMELVGLWTQDIDWNGGTIRLRETKGGHHRMVPVGKRALHWCSRYLSEVRGRLVAGKEPEAFFLTRLGTAFAAPTMTGLVREYILKADLKKTGSCHLFRHAAATAMLEHGADIRYIQELLGHRQLTSTQVYTRVSIRALREVHAATHPAENPEKPLKEAKADLLSEVLLEGEDE